MSNNDNKQNVEVDFKPDVENLEKKAIDQEVKLQLLIKHLEGYCNDESEHDDLRKFGKALRKGAKLTGTTVSGGYTNYSYKINLDCANINEDVEDKNVAVFAKVAFPYALWAPSTDVHYDLSRVTTEFELMNRFSEELKIPTGSDGNTKSPIPKPYVLIDIPAGEDGASPNMKIFVAEWVSPTDEQWGNQFIEGEIDNRVIDQCARTLSMINLADCDDNVNQGFTDSMENITAGIIPLFLGIAERDNDKAVVYARDVLGPEKMDAIIKEWNIRRTKKDCLVHGDAHVFNMLVERKPNVSQLSSFGPKGDFFLCDWEMSHMGAKGQDISNFISFPVMSACFLAARGHLDKAEGIIQSLKHFWNTYKRNLVEGLQKKQAESNGDKDVIDIGQYLIEVFDSAIGYFGFFSFIAFYCLDCFVEFVDTEGLTDEETKEVLAAVGWTGLRSMEVGFLDTSAEQVFGDHDDERLSRMESFFFGMIEKQTKQLSVSRQGSRRPSRRRSSVLRESSRRVSDADSGFGKVVRRLSSQIVVEEY